MDEWINKFVNREIEKHSLEETNFQGRKQTNRYKGYKHMIHDKPTFAVTHNPERSRTKESNLDRKWRVQRDYWKLLFSWCLRYWHISRFLSSLIIENEKEITTLFKSFIDFGLEEVRANRRVISVNKSKFTRDGR